MIKLSKIRFPTPTALAIATGVSLAIAPAKAATISYTNCANTTFCTLEELFAGGSIEIDENLDGITDKIFDTWTFGYEDISPPFADAPAYPIDYSNIQVSAFSSAYNVGLQYDVKNNALLLNPSGEPGERTSQSMLTNYSFNLKSINSWLPTDNSLNLTNATTTVTTVPGGAQPSSGVQIEEKVTDTNGNLISPQGSKLVEQNSAGINNQLTDQMTFPGQSEIVVNNTIQLNATSPATDKRGLAQVNEFRQTFSATQVPEPGALMGLLVFGGLCLTIKRQ